MAGDWTSWNDGYSLPRDWPYPSSGIDVDRVALRRVALQMEKTVDGASAGGPYDVHDIGRESRSSWSDDLHESEVDDPGAVSRLSEESLSGTFGHEVWRETSAWGAYSSVFHWDHVGDLPGSWESVKLFKENLRNTISTIDLLGDTFFESFKGLADTVALTAFNYQAVEDILEHGHGGFRMAVDGKNVLKGEYPLRKGGWFCEDVSHNEAPVIKIFFERSRPELLVAAGETLRSTADRLATAVGAIERHAESLAKAWPGETSTLCLDAMRKLHGTGRTIAYAAGRTSEVCASFGASFQEYKRRGEDLNVDRAGWFDRTFHDGDHDDAMDRARAQELLTRFNSTMGEEFVRLPEELEVYMPHLDGFDANLRTTTYVDEFAELLNADYDAETARQGLDNLRRANDDTRPRELPELRELGQVRRG